MSRDAGDLGGTDRRGFLKSVGTTAAAGGLAGVLGERDVVQTVTASVTDDGAAFEADDERDPAAVFPQSVASGGPTPSGAILWTRIAGDAYVEGAPLGVEVARDEEFSEVVLSGEVYADAIGPEHDYTVKVDVDGQLAPNSFYFYRFTYDGVRSRTGRCRTLPRPGQRLDELSLGVLTCQDYQNGYYPAYHHVAGEDLDYLVHLGDFIYESAAGQYLSPTAWIKPGRELDLPSGNDLAESIEDFRYLYRTYRSDRFLQEALERHTMIVAWDDHEVANDRYWDYATDSPVLPPHGEDDQHDPERAVELAANGIQAWVEHVPARVEYDPGADHLHEQFQLWRSFEFGDLATLAVTDERLYRNAPPCDNFNPFCYEEPSPERTMLGTEQKQWFLQQMGRSNATWQVWANEVLTAPLTIGQGENATELLHDSWDGYRHERGQLFEALPDLTDNLVTLTGDLHAGMAGYQQQLYPADSDGVDVGRFGVEIMTPSVTSVNTADVVDLLGSWGDDLFTGLITSMNDHVEFANWSVHGYTVVRFRRDECRATVYTVDKDTDAADADRAKLVEFRVPEGAPELQRVPTATIDASSTRVVPDEPVTFDATGSEDPDGTIRRHDWAFDDGATATGATVEHAFPSAGTYDVTLRVTDDDGVAETATQRIVVGDDAAACGEQRETTTKTGRIDTGGGSEAYTYATETADPCSVEVELAGDGTADLDLYLTLDGRRPSEADHDRRSWTDDGDERITVDEAALDTDAELGILVKSYRGTGGYDLTVTEYGRADDADGQRGEGDRRGDGNGEDRGEDGGDDGRDGSDGNGRPPGIPGSGFPARPRQ